MDIHFEEVKETVTQRSGKIANVEYVRLCKHWKADCVQAIERKVKDEIAKVDGKWTLVEAADPSDVLSNRDEWIAFGGVDPTPPAVKVEVEDEAKLTSKKFFKSK